MIRIFKFYLLLLLVISCRNPMQISVGIDQPGDDCIDPKVDCPGQDSPGDFPTESFCLSPENDAFTLAWDPYDAQEGFAELAQKTFYEYGYRLYHADRPAPSNQGDGDNAMSYIEYQGYVEFEYQQGLYKQKINFNDLPSGYKSQPFYLALAAYGLYGLGSEYLACCSNEIKVEVCH